MKRTLILIFSIMFITTGMAIAKPPKGDNTSVPMFRWWEIPSIQEELDITETESKQLDTIYKEAKLKMIDFKADAEKKMIHLEMELGQQALNKDVCLKIFRETQDIRSSMAMEKFRFVLTTKEILKHERFVKLNEIYKQHRKKGKAGKQMRKGQKRMRQNRDLSHNMMYKGPDELGSQDMYN